MFLALLLLTLWLHAMTCPQRLTRAWMVNFGGAAIRPHPLAANLSHPVPVRAVMAADLAPATPPPPETTPGTGPHTRQEGVYTPTAHAGAPGRGDGPGSPPGEGTSPGGGRGRRTRVVWWRYGKWHSRPGTAAAPCTGNDRDDDHAPPPCDPQCPSDGQAACTA